MRSKIFYINKLYYIALDTLLVALEFEENDKIYDLISKIYDVLENNELSKKLLDPDLRLNAITSLKRRAIRNFSERINPRYSKSYKLGLNAYA